jgi:hypothetical protein
MCAAEILFKKSCKVCQRIARVIVSKAAQSPAAVSAWQYGLHSGNIYVPKYYVRAY